MKNKVNKTVAEVLPHNLNKEKGITLIALVITIIVLLILAGVAIATLTGENGLLERARVAIEKTEQAETDENSKISNYENEIDKYNVWDRKTGDMTAHELFSSELGSCGTNITISDSYKNYDEIEIYYYACANGNYIKDYQSVKVKVSDLENQNNSIILGGFSNDNASIYYHVTGYCFESEQSLKWIATLRRNMNDGAMYYGDQISVLKIVGYKS